MKNLIDFIVASALSFFQALVRKKKTIGEKMTAASAATVRLGPFEIKRFHSARRRESKRCVRNRKVYTGRFWRAHYRSIREHRTSSRENDGPG